MGKKKEKFVLKTEQIDTIESLKEGDAIIKFYGSDKNEPGRDEYLYIVKDIKDERAVLDQLSIEDYSYVGPYILSANHLSSKDVRYLVLKQSE